MPYIYIYPWQYLANPLQQPTGICGLGNCRKKMGQACLSDPQHPTIFSVEACPIFSGLAPMPCFVDPQVPTNIFDGTLVPHLSREGLAP